MEGYEIFIDAIEKRGSQFSDKTAITYMREDGTRTYTSYKDILEGCKKIKGLFKAAGIIPGDRVAIVAPHSPQAVLAALGGAYANVTTVLIGATLPDSEIDRLLDFSDVRGLFATDKLYERIGKDQKKDIPVFQLCERENEYVLFGDSEVRTKKEKTADPEKDVIAILFSSGTTAQMKGIKVTYQSVLKASEIFVRNIAWKPEYKYLHVFPLNHIAGFATMQAFLSCGSELGMIENMNASKLLETLLQYQPHGFGMIPKVFETMEDKIREKIHAKGKAVETLIGILLLFSGWLRKTFGIKIGRKLFKFLTKQVFGENIITIGTGASLCRESTSKFFIDMGLNWANFYALTETNVPAVSTGIFDRYPVLMAGNVKRNPEIEVKINNPGAEGIGEIYIKSELLMKGYFREEELTNQSFDGDYFKTGDYGYIDKKNNLYVTGRVKEAILLHNGKKVSPTDVEKYYLSFLSNIEIACCGCLKENKQYDEVCMFIQTAGKTEDELNEIVALLRKESERASQLYKLDHIMFIEKLPLTTVGKVKRFELQKRAMSVRTSADAEVYRDVVGDSTEKKIAQLICKILNRNQGMGLETRLKEDLGMDSLNLFELQSAVETSFGMKFTADWMALLTIRDLVRYIEKKSSGKEKENAGKKEETEYYLKNRSEKEIKYTRHLVRVLDRSCKVKYIGLENVIEGPCIFAANHSSHLDIMCVYKAIIQRYGYEKLHKVCCLAAKELVQQKGMTETFHALGAIPVDRKGNTIKAFAVLNKYIQKKGYSAVIFPEGTRTRTGKLGKFTDGVAGAAIMSNVPVVPIGVSGSFDIWPATRKRPKFSLFRKTVTVRIGEVIYPEGKDVSEFTGVIREKIEELLKEKR